ncbi:hypothetical protein AB1N83_000951 [Pleurotus pulmonarius]
MLNLILAILLAAVMETLLLGAYLVVFASSCRTIFAARRRGWLKGALSNGLLAVDFAMFLSIIAHWALGIARLFEGLGHDHTAALEYFHLISEGKLVAKVALYVFQCLLADIIMVLRLYYVSMKSLGICALPILTTSGLAVAGSGLVWQLTTAQPYRDPFISGQWVWSCFTLTLATTMYSTSVIAYKLWSSYKSVQNMNVNPFVDSRVPRAIQVIVESAAIYSEDLYIHFLHLTSPVVGLVLCLVVARGRTVVRDHLPELDLHPSSWSESPPPSRNWDPNPNRTSAPSLVVNIDQTRIIQHDGDLVIPTNKMEQEDVESTAEGHGVEAC